jgi:hypothetical protein
MAFAAGRAALFTGALALVRCAGAFALAAGTAALALATLLARAARMPALALIGRFSALAAHHTKLKGLKKPIPVSQDSSPPFFSLVRVRGMFGGIVNFIGHKIQIYGPFFR